MLEKLEAHAILKLRIQREAQLAQMEEAESKIKAQLRAAVPKSLGAWLDHPETDSILNDLVKGRVRGWSYSQEERSIYDFENLEEFARRFDELTTAWQEVVEIRIDRVEESRFGISFMAI